MAEAQLLQRNFEAAADLYLQAVLIAPEYHGSHQSTRGQAVLILDALQASPESRQKVLVAFEHPGCHD